MSRVQLQIATALRERLRQMSTRNPPNGRDGFDEEMDQLLIVDHRLRSNADEFYTSSLATNVMKNRFVEVSANERTRVRLHPSVETNNNNDSNSNASYINANHVNGRELFGVPFTYIATQAPLSNTILDFWRMVFENNVVFIVMLCGEMENGKSKSEVYWPSEEESEMNLGFLQVKFQSEKRLSDVVYRSFVLHSASGEGRDVYHMQYVAWPDQGIPGTSASLMEIIQTMGKSELSVQAPILVHCSGGIGRTGVFIALHVALALFQLERKDIDIQRIVHTLKLCRSGMVQRKDQYVFLYYAVLREMERMILSVYKGVDLLEIRHRGLTRKQMTPDEDTYITNPLLDSFQSVDMPSKALPRTTTTTRTTIPHRTCVPRKHFPAVRKSGHMVPHRMLASSLPAHSSRITEAEDELLENYLKRQMSSFPQQTTILHNDSLRRYNGENMMKSCEATAPGLRKDSKFKPHVVTISTPTPTTSHNIAALEEQLHLWQLRNKEMRFSIDQTECEEKIAIQQKPNINPNRSPSTPPKQHPKEKLLPRETLGTQLHATPEVVAVEVQKPPTSPRAVSAASDPGILPTSIIITPKTATGTTRNSYPTFCGRITGESPSFLSYGLGDAKENGPDYSFVESVKRVPPRRATSIRAIEPVPATSPKDLLKKSAIGHSDRMREAMSNFESPSPFPHLPRSQIIAKEELDQL